MASMRCCTEMLPRDVPRDRRRNPDHPPVGWPGGRAARLVLLGRPRHRQSHPAPAGGYVGDGVGTTNLAGRTLCDLIVGDTTELTELPWVNHRSPNWEPEPLRWLGINTMVRLPIGADRYEEAHQRPERWRSAIVTRLTGH